MRGRRNEKKSSIVFICVCLLLSFIFIGCCTNRKPDADVSDVIAGNSSAVGKLETTISALDGTVSDSRARIANVIETSRSITDGIERLEYLFGEYEREVNRILNEIDRIRNEAERIRIELEEERNDYQYRDYHFNSVLISSSGSTGTQN